jgi:hypothetical protein
MLQFYLYVIVFFSWPSLCAVSILTLSYSCCFYFFVTKKTGVGGAVRDCTVPDASPHRQSLFVDCGACHIQRQTKSEGGSVPSFF